jgi:hypothetical protein
MFYITLRFIWHFITVNPRHSAFCRMYWNKSANAVLVCAQFHFARNRNSV